MCVARQQGMRRLDGIDAAVVERNGGISVYKKRTPGQE